MPILHPLFPTAPVKATYNVTDIAAILGVSRSSVYSYISAGLLEALDLAGRNRQKRVPRESLVSFINSSKHDPHA